MHHDQAIAHLRHQEWVGLHAPQISFAFNVFAGPINKAPDKDGQWVDAPSHRERFVSSDPAFDVIEPERGCCLNPGASSYLYERIALCSLISFQAFSWFLRRWVPVKQTSLETCKHSRRSNVFFLVTGIRRRDLYH